MGQLGDLYVEGRDRIIGVVSDVDPHTPVPTCPAWTVHDVLAHVAGICADILSGTLDGVATDPWTAAQVEARRDKTIAEIVAEWQETGPQIDAMIDAFGRTGEQLLVDLTSHEHDIRLALGKPGAQDAPVLDVAAEFIVAMGLDPKLRELGTAPLQIHADASTWNAGGAGEPGATLTTTRFDLLRAATGRRSTKQIAAMSWDGDPAPYLAAFQSELFTPSPIDIDE